MLTNSRATLSWQTTVTINHLDVATLTLAAPATGKSSKQMRSRENILPDVRILQAIHRLSA
jgi:hypothetical protein